MAAVAASGSHEGVTDRAAIPDVSEMAGASYVYDELVSKGLSVNDDTDSGKSKLAALTSVATQNDVDADLRDGATCSWFRGACNGF